MKQSIQLGLTLLVAALVMGGCLDPVSVLTDPQPTPAVNNSGRVRQLPGPTTMPATDQPRTSSGAVDTSNLLRDPVTAADQANQQLLDAANIPITDLRDLAIRFKGLPASTPRKNCTSTPEINLGDQQQFSVLNSRTQENFTVTATLVDKNDTAYLWLDNRWLNQVDLNALKRSAQAFNDQIVPRNHALFGIEETPGIDCDPRLHILNTSGTNAGGYFSGIDQVTRQVRADSNEKDMLYIDVENNGGLQAVGTGYYDGVIAHELQHLITYKQDGNEDTWIGEGMSELAIFLNGQDPDAVDWLAAQNPNIQLNSWPDGGPAGHEYYGTAFSFMLYFWDRYGDAGVQALAAEPANGLAGIQNTLHKIDPGKQVNDLVADWLIARLLDDPSIDNGRFGYSKTDRARVAPRQAIDHYPFAEQAQVHQYAGDYTELHGSRDLTIDFTGSTKAQMIDAHPHSGQYFMWSNRADAADLRLQREFDLSSVKNATLNYWTWYDLEENWDYGYVSVSADGGQTWQLLHAPTMTNTNPVNANYGWGYTGKSGGGDRAEWIQESIDLTPFAGRKILVAFDVINDQGVNRPGMAVDDVSVPEINYHADFEQDDGGWQPAGWVRTNNFVPQNYIVQLVSFAPNGQPTVSRLPVNEDNTAHWDIPLSQLQKAIIVVSPMASWTTEVARYNWSAQEK